MAKTNKEILNAIRNEASAEYKERIPEIRSEGTHEGCEEALRNLTEYPTLRNEFINALTAKIFKTVVMNKVWNNPLTMLKKGEVPYGQGIEQLFVEMAEKKEFHEENVDAANNLLKKEVPDVQAKFIQRNFAYKYKVSLSNQRLRSAFMAEGGVARLIDGLVASVMTGANNEEFNDMLGILTRKEDRKEYCKGSGLAKVEKGIMARIKESETSKMFVPVTGEAKDLVEKIRTYASELSFLSKDYKLAGVTTACNPEDLVLFTTSDMVAKIDVHVIASAFNVSATDVNVRIIKVPMNAFKELAAESGNWCDSDECSLKTVTPVAVLADKDAIQQYDTLIESGSFYNPDQLMTNMFVHRQGITASCDFAQTIVFGTVAGE